MYDPRSIGLLFRYPPRALSEMISAPCPVPHMYTEELEKNQSALMILQSGQALKHTAKEKR